ncbi:MAG: hypothetical protein WCK53_05640 [Methanomicrobiales archaeon]
MTKRGAKKLFQLNAIFSAYVDSGCSGSVEDLMTSGRFNIGEDVRWISFAKTFDVVGRPGSRLIVSRVGALT